MIPIAARYYLAGIFDGEGCVVDVTTVARCRPKIEMANCDQDIIKATCDALRVLEIEHVVRLKVIANPRHSDITLVTVQKRDAIDRFAAMVPIFSEAKKKRLLAAVHYPRQRRYGALPVELVRRLYWEDELSIAEVAVCIDWDKQVLQSRMVKEGIPRRAVGHKR